MSRVKVRTGEKLDWIEARTAVTAAQAAKMGEGELSARFRVRDAGGPDSPQLLEVQFAPDARVDLHAHTQDEIMYILAGSIIVGPRCLGVGTSLSIKGMTLYQFEAGPDGLTTLNFRPAGDLTYLTRDDVLRVRSAATAVDSGEDRSS